MSFLLPLLLPYAEPALEYVYQALTGSGQSAQASTDEQDYQDYSDGYDDSSDEELDYFG